MTIKHLESPGEDDPFARVALGDDDAIFLGRVPVSLEIASREFDELWETHPQNPPIIRVHGWTGPAPRWKQAFEHDYRFSGQTSQALPLPVDLRPFLDWVKAAVDARLNGVLVNWYDAALGHYIGPHHDKVLQLVEGSPIATISLGDARSFRLERPGEARVDIRTTDGLVIVMPWATNDRWKHSIPKAGRNAGRRVSLTFRCFKTQRSK